MTPMPSTNPLSTVQRRSFALAFAQPIGVYDSGLDPAAMAELESPIEEFRLISSGRRRSNAGGWWSEGNFFDTEVADVSRLKALRNAAAFDYLRSCSAKVNETGQTCRLLGWANVNAPGHSKPER